MGKGGVHRGWRRRRTWERGDRRRILSATVWILSAIPAVDGRHVEIVNRDATCVLAALLNEQILPVKIEVLDIYSIRPGRHASRMLLYLEQRHGTKQVAP